MVLGVVTYMDRGACGSNCCVVAVEVINMKKIPTLFERIYDNNGRIIGITDTVKPGFEWVLSGDGIATIKIDGSCCAIFNGIFYKRYDAKKGKIPPTGAIPCTPEPDPVTGHWPHWVKVDFESKTDKWFVIALRNTFPYGMSSRWNDKTYEAIGKHFNDNPYNMEYDVLRIHGNEKILDCPRTFGGIKEFLKCHHIEGIVFWKDGEPQCKIKRSDFGYKWP